MKQDDDKVVCETPTPGKLPTRMPRWKYEAVERTILDVVPTTDPGIEFKELPKRVAEALDDDVRARLGSVSWHTTCVKLHLEVIGKIKRIAGQTPQRLVRVD